MLIQPVQKMLKIHAKNREITQSLNKTVCLNIVKKERNEERKNRERRWPFVLSHIKPGDIMPAGKAAQWYYTIDINPGTLLLFTSPPAPCSSIWVSRRRAAALSSTAQCCQCFSRYWNLKPPVQRHSLWCWICISTRCNCWLSVLVGVDFVFSGFNLVPGGKADWAEQNAVNRWSNSCWESQREFNLLYCILLISYPRPR